MDELEDIINDGEITKKIETARKKIRREKLRFYLMAAAIVTTISASIGFGISWYKVHKEFSARIEQEERAIAMEKRINAAMEKTKSYDGIVDIMPDDISGWTERVNKPSLANIILDNFPEDLPGASKVEKYFAPEAKQCLVHVRQMHSSKFGQDPPLEDINRVQEDVYRILTHLIDNHHTYEVYAEGVYLGMDVGHHIIVTGLDLVSLKGKIMTLDDKLKDAYQRNNQEEIQALELEKSKVKKEFDIGSTAFNNAPFRLYMDKKAKISACEFESTILESTIATYQYFLDEITKEEYEDKVLEQRERVALVSIANHPLNPMPVIVYGAGHSFVNNVIQWNLIYPDKKFSLVVITPESLKEID